MKTRSLMIGWLMGLFILGSAGPPAWAEEPITVKEVNPLGVASIRKTVAVDKIGEAMSAMFKELFDELGALGLSPAGPPLAVFHSVPQKMVDVEACVPVSQLEHDKEPVRFRTLPGGSMASLIYTGPYEKAQPQLKRLFTWMEDNGYKIAGANREVYLKGPPDTNPEAYRTEILWPVRKK